MSLAFTVCEWRFSTYCLHSVQSNPTDRTQKRVCSISQSFSPLEKSAQEGSLITGLRWNKNRLPGENYRQHPTGASQYRLSGRLSAWYYFSGCRGNGRIFFQCPEVIDRYIHAETCEEDLLVLHLLSVSDRRHTEAEPLALCCLQNNRKPDDVGKQWNKIKLKLKSTDWWLWAINWSEVNIKLHPPPSVPFRNDGHDIKLKTMKGSAAV